MAPVAAPVSDNVLVAHTGLGDADADTPEGEPADTTTDEVVAVTVPHEFMADNVYIPAADALAVNDGL